VRASRRHPKHVSSPGLTLTQTTESELQAARSLAPELPFALEYPRMRDAFAGALPDTLRHYDIRDQQGRLHKIYVIVIDRGQLGEFYDVQGTDWTSPPLLSNPSQTAHIGSRTYELFYEGEAIRTIAWREDGAVYWIENTLTSSVSPRALLAIAQQTVPVIRPNGSVSPNPAALGTGQLNLPSRGGATTSLTAKLEAALGFLSLVIVALLGTLVISRQRKLGVLREEVAHAMALEERQRILLAAGTARPAPQLGPPRPSGAPPTAER
jgi:hypothetical protein